jgi:hypothetical protein
VGHMSLTQKKRKILVEPDLGMKKTPKANRSLDSDDNLLNFYGTDDVMSDDKNNGLSIANLDEDDMFGFLN